MASTIAAKIQQFYNAYFGRPADPAGLAFWEAGANATGDLIGSAIRLFGDPGTPEFARMYPPGTSIESFLDSAYTNMFNRAPDADGKQYWADAFRFWVGTGVYSEGEARAQILATVLDAADRQVGTADKLSLVNKQIVADAATASVKQFGTQSIYTASLDDARTLLANVDGTQASVNAALARIQYGEVLRPGATSSDAPYIITSFPAAKDQSIDLGWMQGANGEFVTTGRDIVKFGAASDAPFSYVAYDFGGSSFYSASGRSIAYAEADRDRIDLTAFHLNVWATGSNIAVKSSGLMDRTSTGGPPQDYRVHQGFFEGKALAMYESSTGFGGATTEIFVDVNHNGNLDPEADMWLSVSLPMSRVNEGLFIL
jgi:hypothetical protein